MGLGAGEELRKGQTGRRPGGSGEVGKEQAGRRPGGSGEVGKGKGRAAGPAAQPPPRRLAPGGPARRAGRPAARCRHPAGGCRGSGGRRAEGALQGPGGGRGRGKAPCRNRAARRATLPEGGFGGGRRPPPTAAKPPALRACVLPIWQGAVSGGAFVLEPAQKFAEGAATLCILAADMIR